MKIPSKIIAMAFATALLASCNNANDVETTADAQQEMVERYNQERSDIEADLKDIRSEIDQEMNDIEKRMDKADEATKVKLMETKAQLAEERNKVDAAIGDLKNSTQENWDEFKIKVDRTGQSIKEDWNRMRQNIKERFDGDSTRVM